MKGIELKKKQVEEIVNLCSERKTLAITNIEKVDANKFKDIRKKLKEDVIIKVVKKSVIERVLKELGIDFKDFEDIISKPIAIMITNLDPFKLAAILEENKSFTYLKPGQIVEKDIVIEKGPTSLPPTAIADLSKAGLKVGVEKGKVVIKEEKIIKGGESISQELADALQKLDIKPVKIGFNVNIGIDLANKKVYKNIIIDKEKEKESLNKAINYAYNLALNINYICKTTINVLIQKAVAYANQLNKFIEGKK